MNHVGGNVLKNEIYILKEIAELLNESTNKKAMLDEALTKLLAVTGLRTGWVFLIDEPGETHELAAHQALPPVLSNEQETVMCQGACWCVDRYRNGKLHKATNIIECARIEQAMARNVGDHQGLTHHATVPLRAGEEQFGLLNIGSPGKESFSDAELALLESVAFQIGTALKRIVLTERERETALIAERNRLARDLHDSVNQLLFSVTLTSRAGRELSKEPHVQQAFTHIQDLAQEALWEMRSLIWQLRPMGLERGLVSSLLDHAKLLGLQCKVKVTGVVTLPANVEENLWRIGQEALANCKKHAQTNNVELELTQNKDGCMMKIIDHGCGFQYDESVTGPSLGLTSMRERVRSLRGQLTVESELGVGTVITITLPLSKEGLR